MTHSENNQSGAQINQIQVKATFRMVAFGLSPFEEFAITQKLTEAEAQDFFNSNFVGANLYSDSSILSILYVLWKEARNSRN